MDPDLRQVASNMREVGLSILGRGVHDATYGEMGIPCIHAVAVAACANGAELLLKARIAQEHPLLIFTKVPTVAATADRLLKFEDLLHHGRTRTFEELPEVLWAATGCRVPSLERYLAFGRLRNQIMHFAIPSIAISDESLRFSFQVMEPMIETFWGDSLMNYVDEMNDETADIYLPERLTALGIQFGPHLPPESLVTTEPPEASEPSGDSPLEGEG